MSLNSRLFTGAPKYDDPRINGSGSTATATYVLSEGGTNNFYYTSASAPTSGWSSVTIGTTFAEDILWDGFTWIVSTFDGVYQTKDSSFATGWTRVIDWSSTDYYGSKILPVPEGNLVISGHASNGTGQIAYTTTINPSSVSASDWSTKALGFSGDVFDAEVYNEGIVIGRRQDSGTGPQFYYTSSEDFFASGSWNDMTLASAELSWGTRISTDGTKIIGCYRAYNGVFYMADLDSGKSYQSLSPDYWHQLNYINGYWTATRNTGYNYKTTYNGNWTSGGSATTDYNTRLFHNGTYYLAGMNYSSSDSQALVYKTSLSASNSYVSASTIGMASGSYVRQFKPSVLTNKGGWQNLGTASPTFAA